MYAGVLGKKCPPELESTTLEDVVVWVDPLDGTSEFAQVSPRVLNNFVQYSTVNPTIIFVAGGIVTSKDHFTVAHFPTPLPRARAQVLPLKSVEKM